MRTQICQFALGLVLVALGWDVRVAAAQSAKADVRLTVHIQNYADVNPKILASAERVATQIFRKAGVESRWIETDGFRQNPSDNSADVSSLGLSHIWLNILSPAMASRAGLPNSTMGFAPGSGPDRRVVDVFYQRVNELAESQAMLWAQGMIPLNAKTGQVLGAVIAHEIGHVLLNLSSHTQTGIMRGDWDQEDLYDVSAGCLLFTSYQAEVIRTELVRRDGKRQQAVVAKADSKTLAKRMPSADDSSPRSFDTSHCSCCGTTTP
jgi:hypothetical protein